MTVHNFLSYWPKMVVVVIMLSPGFVSPDFRFRLSFQTLLGVCFLSQQTFLSLVSAEPIRSQEKVVLLPTELQMRQHNEAHVQCLQAMETDPYPVTGGLYCNRTWDNIMCWPDVPSGFVAFQPCPVYLSMSRTNANASRQCLSDGSWFVHPTHNITWTNYSQCTTNDTTPSEHDDDYNAWMKKHVGYIKVIYQIGYGLSLVTLSAAVCVMVYFKKLHCHRNTLHINLFLSFILRAVMSFLRDTLLVAGLGLEKDVIRDEGSNVVVFRDDVTHWECRLLMVVFNYAMTNNYMWIFVEGLYLHTLIFTDVFLEMSSVDWYIVFGWTSALVVVVPWAIVRASLENVLCWNTHPTSAYFWIIKTPVVITVLLNFFFFINTVRVLMTKLKASTSSGLQRCMHRRLAKSTLVLIPLFGVPYMVFLGLPDNPSCYTAEVVKLYFEMTFNSFNGVLVAILFCFLNGEVQSEVRKKWRRYNTLNSVTRNGVQHHQTMTTAGGGVRRCSPPLTSSTTAVYFPRFARHSAYSIQSLFTRLDSIVLNGGDQAQKHQQEPSFTGATAECQSPSKKKRKRLRMNWIYRRRMDTMAMATIKDCSAETDGVTDPAVTNAVTNAMAHQQKMIPLSNRNSLNDSNANGSPAEQQVVSSNSIENPCKQSNDDFAIKAG